jgi:hypothetical protein
MPVQILSGADLVGMLLLRYEAVHARTQIGRRQVQMRSRERTMGRETQGRVSMTDTKPYYELRPDSEPFSKKCGMGESLDEIVSGRVKFFHLERMDTNCYWIGLDIDNGDHIRVIIQAARAPVHTWAEVEKSFEVKS